ncbi:hypothetical protein MVEN_02519600 [Mycena venus]|uniref:Uncharacterized protein n=1 Tax=Mycena venus TaxID=2733690 RepID=A0A8H7C940_9AGAR|nr:hypothetical protein MVEN_02519600 [Mycena venus]
MTLQLDLNSASAATSGNTYALHWSVDPNNILDGGVTGILLLQEGNPSFGTDYDILDFDTAGQANGTYLVEFTVPWLWSIPATYFFMAYADPVDWGYWDSPSGATPLVYGLSNFFTII